MTIPTSSGHGLRHLLFIVPAFNERDSLPAVIGDLRGTFPDAHVLLVDDGSSDDSAAVARACGADAVKLPFNLGIGGAVQTGFRYAARSGYRYAVQFDGDGQHRADQVETLLAPLERGECDVVIGSRFLGDDVYCGTRRRRAGIGILQLVNRLLLRRRITDSTSGFRAYNRSALAFLAADYPRDYPEPESIVALLRGGFRVQEVPVRMRQRQGGASSITFLRSIYYMAKVLVALIIGATRQRRDVVRHESTDPSHLPGS